MSVTDKTRTHSSSITPSADRRWRFGDVDAAELVSQLQRYVMTHCPNHYWQIVWLENEGQPVIGLLPKVSWSVYAIHDSAPDAKSQALYKVVTYDRDTDHSTQDDISYDEWQQRLIDYSRQHDYESCDANDIIKTTSRDYQTDHPRYHHGLIGFIGYDIAASHLSPQSDIKQAAMPAPSAVLGHYDLYLSLDDQGWSLRVITDKSASAKSQSSAVNTVTDMLTRVDRQLSDPLDHYVSSPARLTLRARWQKADYARAFYQVQDYLTQGDCYQINLTQVWQGTLDSHTDKRQGTDTNQGAALVDHLPALQRRTRAPFAGYLGAHHLHGSHKHQSHQSLHDSQRSPYPLGFELLSCSPELFFTFSKDTNIATAKRCHHIRTKPIKGTIPRGMNAIKDAALKQQLTTSDKDRSENVMIVDLLRNDLGKYAQTGSVKVPSLFAIESFSNVHHMVSTITATLKPSAHPLTVLFGSLPAGSITGAPKVRAVEIIDELEPAPRGAYCGTMGYMNFDGSGQWNVLIRSLQALAIDADQKQVSLWAGGGITIASDCDAEYQECLDKVGNLLAVLAQTN